MQVTQRSNKQHLPILGNSECNKAPCVRGSIRGGGRGVEEEGIKGHDPTLPPARRASPRHGLCQHCRLGSFIQWSCWMSVVFKHKTHHPLQFLKLPSLHYSHFIEEETQASRGNLICLKSHSEYMTEIEVQSELRSKSRSICLQSHCHTVTLSKGKPTGLQQTLQSLCNGLWAWYNHTHH